MAAVDKETKIAAMMLSALMTTGDDQLAGFRKKRLGRGSKVDLAHLRRARDVLTVIAKLVKEDNEERWDLLQQVWKLLLEQQADDDRDIVDPETEAAQSSDEPSLSEDGPADEDSSGHVIESQDSDPPKPPKVGSAPVAGELPPEIAAKINKPSPWVAPARALAARGGAGGPPLSSGSPPSLAQGPASLGSGPASLGSGPISLGGATAALGSPSAALGTSTAALGSAPEALGSAPVAVGSTPVASAPVAVGSAPPAAGSGPGDQTASRGSHPPLPIGEASHVRVDQAPSPHPPVSAAAPLSPSSPITLDDGDVVSTTGPAIAATRSVLPFDEDKTQQHKSATETTAPFDNKALTAMPVERYAALCALCGVFPERLTETHARFGIEDNDTRQKLDALWHGRFSKNTSLHQLWGVLFAQFRQWLPLYGRESA